MSTHPLRFLLLILPAGLSGRRKVPASLLSYFQVLPELLRFCLSSQDVPTEGCSCSPSTGINRLIWENWVLAGRGASLVATLTPTTSVFVLPAEDSKLPTPLDPVPPLHVGHGVLAWESSNLDWGGGSWERTRIESMLVRN